MSAPSGGASSAPQCACTNISIMQLFHELKQQFPGVPDHVVSNTISSHCHDRSACQSRLECEAKNFVSNLYPSSSLSTSKKVENKDILLPQHCPNQLSTLKDSNREIQLSLNTTGIPLTSLGHIHKDQDYDLNDYNQNNLKLNPNENKNIGFINNNFENIKGNVNEFTRNIHSSKVDNKCGSIELPLELQDPHDYPLLTDARATDTDCSTCISENYTIFKSNKVRSDLNRKLEGQDAGRSDTECSFPKTAEKGALENVKLKRPNTLKLNALPFDGFEQKYNNKVSPVAESKQPKSKNDCYDFEEEKETHEGHKISGNKSTLGSHDNFQSAAGQRMDEAYPLNVSVNLNCRMDVLPPACGTRSCPYADPWRGDYPGSANYTSVNLTVCTPTTSVHGVPADTRIPPSPHENIVINQGESRQRNFEGLVQITVSPASSRRIYHGPSVPRRRFPLGSDTMTEPVPTTPLEVLVRRQRARLERLQRALAAERARLAAMQREVCALAAPLPRASRLRPAVLRLRALCQRLARLLDRAHSTDEQLYDDMCAPGAGTRPRPGAEEGGHSWQCHVCTFRNHALLNKCEECDMPRIILGMTDKSSASAVPPAPVRLSLLPLADISNNQQLDSGTNNSKDVENLIKDFDCHTITSEAKVHENDSLEALL